MGAPQIHEADVDRAHHMVDELLRPARRPAVIRHRVERILAKCRPGSRRYAFWRLILALVVAEAVTALGPDSRPAGPTRQCA